MRFALINQENTVVNIIIWEGAEFLPPKHHYIVKSDHAKIGDKFNEETNEFYFDSCE